MKRCVVFVVASLFLGCVLCWVGAFAVHAWSFETGRLVVTLTDVDGLPITNATVSTRTLNRLCPNAGVYESHYTTTTVPTDSNGVADVSFRFIDPYFDWYVNTPSHHSSEVRGQGECFKADVVESDYMNIDTNSVQGLAMYNELKNLAANDDIEGYLKKFEPKSVAYSSKIIHRSLGGFYPKHDPRPMFAYRAAFLPPRLPNGQEVVESNGVRAVVYPSVEFDMKRNGFLPPYGRKGAWGEIADFRIERHAVVTNGVVDFRGRMVFAPGCGFYKGVMTSSPSFPSVYEADTNAVYLPVLEFSVLRDATTERVLSSTDMLSTNEYMVLRTRMSVDEDGQTNGWHYAKILGLFRVEREFQFNELVFNPRFGDANLEFDSERNLAGFRGDGCRP